MMAIDDVKHGADVTCRSEGEGAHGDWRRRRSDSAAPLDRLDTSLQAFRFAERTYRANDAASLHRAAAAIHALNGALLECEDAAIDPDLLREKVSGARHLHRRSELCRRLQDWPRGYPGDWESIDYLLDGVNRTPEEDFGHALEQHALWCAASQQHRNKVQHQTMLFDRLIARRPHAKALSIACGGSRDLASLVHRAREFRGQLVLNDADSSALDVSLARLAPFGDRCIRVQGSALNVVSQAAHFGPYDLVVAGGLFDYLSDGLAIRLLREVYRRCVAAEGLFLFTNIATGNPYRPWMSYLGSWHLIERSHDALINLCLRASIPPRRDHPHARRHPPRLAHRATQTGLRVVTAGHRDGDVPVGAGKAGRQGGRQGKSAEQRVSPARPLAYPPCPLRQKYAAVFARCGLELEDLVLRKTIRASGAAVVVRVG